MGLVEVISALNEEEGEASDTDPRTHRQAVDHSGCHTLAGNCPHFHRVAVAGFRMWAEFFGFHTMADPIGSHAVDTPAAVQVGFHTEVVLEVAVALAVDHQSGLHGSSSGTCPGNWDGQVENSLDI